MVRACSNATLLSIALTGSILLLILGFPSATTRAVSLFSSLVLGRRGIASREAVERPEFASAPGPRYLASPASPASPPSTSPPSGATLPPALETWRSSACQDLYRDKVDSAQKVKSTWVEEAGVFLPSSESHRMAPAYPHAATGIRRAITYEDVAWPRGYRVRIGGAYANTTTSAFRQWCMPWYIRTPVLASKAGYASCGRKKVLYVPVWKSASTSTENLLWYGMVCKNYRSFHSYRSPKNCNGDCMECPPGLGPCKFDTTMPRTLPAHFKFSFVREPWDRFLAGVHEHGLWNKVMSTNTKDIENMARKVHRDFPHVIHGEGACEYKTQSYLLSGTDIFGNPIQYDFLGRVEDMQGSLRNLSQFLGVNVLAGEQHQNPSGNLSAVVSARAQKMPFVVCVVCRVFLQDYICFGYPLPERCCKNRCGAFGIRFEPRHLQAAKCF
mmetsp:Transcript_73978/g.204145  ORF Transcript_73978/g.204145 Transcript_73978/m.204145 type:complete len:442 (+) Transcript_73978:92-1417(+)